MEIMDYVSLVMIATGLVCVVILFWLNDFDFDAVMFEYTDEDVIK